jgi:type II secretory pathway pseudopilin PulG
MRFKSSRLAHGRNRSASFGFSILELSVVMIITAVLTVAIVVNFLLANDSHRANLTIQEVTDLVDNVHSLFGTSPNYANLTTAYMATDTQVDPAYINGSGLVDPFKGAVTIIPNTVNTPSDSIAVNVTGLPTSACIKLALWNFGSSFVSSSVGGYSSSNNAPLAPASAISACGSQYNSVTLVFN